MTAIAISYDKTSQDFVVAADGRCATYLNGSVQVASDTAQKIFPFESQYIVIAYALTGISAFGSFQLVPEIKSQIEALSTSPTISNGYALAFKASSKLVLALEAAKKDGRIPNIPPCDLIPAEAGTKKFTVFLFGYFREKQFFSQMEFHYDDNLGKFGVEPFHTQLVQNLIWHTGSRPIGRMLYDPAWRPDPRIAQFKNDASSPKDALITTCNFVKACSLPFAPEIDPQCRIVGGHLHAARVAKEGFNWLIPPATHS